MPNKKLILSASPPACGKTTLAKKLAAALGDVVYIDKDALNPFGKQICRLCGKPYDPDSEFFVREIRELEYEVTMGMAYEALEFANAVIVNAPFGKEIRDVEYMTEVTKKAAALGAEVFLVFIMANADLCRVRMTARGSIRDVYKLENWEEYVSGINFAPPTPLESILHLYLYHNETPEADSASLAELLKYLGK